jgi:hypothetical protein
MGHTSYGEAPLYQGVLIRCQSYHDDDVCSCDKVDTLGGDGTTSTTQVLVVRCAWMPVVISYLSRHLILLFPEDPTPTLLARHWQPPSVASGG